MHAPLVAPTAAPAAPARHPLASRAALSHAAHCSVPQHQRQKPLMLSAGLSRGSHSPGGAAHRRQPHRSPVVVAAAAAAGGGPSTGNGGGSGSGKGNGSAPQAVGAAAAQGGFTEAEVLDRRGQMSVMVYSAKPFVEKYFLAPLRAKGFTNLRHTAANLDPETARIAKGCDAVALFVNDDAGAESMAVLAECGVRFIAMRCAGFDRVDLAAAAAAGIKVARVPAYSPVSVAEHAVALMFAIERHITNAAARVAQGNYALSGLVGRQVGGKVAGVLGTGAIGAEAARMFKGLGMEVLAYDLKPNPKVEAMGIPYVSWEHLLPRADVVSIHIPLLPSTHHFMDAKKFSLMKRGATLLNVSRGGLIDSDALLSALRSGHLGGVGLDVYEGEGSLFFTDWTTLQAQDRMKFWDRRFKELVTFPQVLVTPHTAFLTGEALDSIAATTADNLTAFALGQTLVNEVKAPPPPPQQQQQEPATGAKQQ